MIRTLVTIGLCYVGGAVIVAGLMWLAYRAGLFREAPACEPPRGELPQTIVDSRFAAIVRAEAIRDHPSQRRPS